MGCFVICDKNIVLRQDGSLTKFSDLQKIKDLNTFSDYFEEKAFDLKVLVLKSADKLPDEFKAITLREYYFNNPEDEAFFAFRAAGLANWRRTSKFCGVCGNPMENHKSLTARKCPACGNLVFPRISPCIIVMITKGDQVLLAKPADPSRDFYALIAGYIESGESAEHAVAREVLEETGLKVKNIKYRGSQGWPFPDQLMFGFTAEYDSGEIVIQKEELSDAQWFDRNNFPASTPKPGSIAYKLINGLI